MALQRIAHRLGLGMAEKPPGDSEGESEPDRLNIDYIKGNLFRTVRPDGAIGTLTPHGLIHLIFFAERQAVPQRVVHKLEADGSLGEVLEVVGRDAVVREAEVAISLDVETAEAAVRLLTDLLKEAQAKDNIEETDA
jgi:hypothetical protein